jgi:threonine aldolase
VSNDTTPGGDLPERRRAALRGARKILSGRPWPTVRESLAELAAVAPDLDADMYGTGELLERLEGRVAELLGTEAAVFLPSGTLAQSITLRCWADRTGNRAVAMHPLSHLELHESEAYRRLHGLEPVWLTREPRQPTAEDVRGAAERFGTVAVELPLRDAGFLLPSWDELLELVAAARDREAVVHLDGARLWESTPYLGRSLAEVAGLFDSVYVSFYKGLAGLAGAALAGPATLVEEVKVWQHRQGGRLFTVAPFAVSALHGLEAELPRLAGRVEVARRLAPAVAAVPGLTVFPDPPHTFQFRVYASAPAEDVDRAVLEYAEREGVWLLSGSSPAGVPGWSYSEFTAWDGAVGWEPAEVTDTLTTALAPVLKV